MFCDLSLICLWWLSNWSENDFNSFSITKPWEEHNLFWSEKIIELIEMKKNTPKLEGDNKIYAIQQLILLDNSYQYHVPNNKWYNLNSNISFWITRKTIQFPSFLKAFCMIWCRWECNNCRFSFLYFYLSYLNSAVSVIWVIC